jgi:hypothetical protein
MIDDLPQILRSGRKNSSQYVQTIAHGAVGTTTARAPSHCRYSI